LALQPRPGEKGGPAAPNRDKARAWLEKTPAGDTNQALNVRLLFLAREGKPAGALKPVVERLRRAQNPDGSWSQLPGLPGDGLAAGQTVYARRQAGVSPQDPALARGLAFLLKKQKPDGSWDIPSQPFGPKKARARDNGPISYVGTGWATLALVS